MLNNYAYTLARANRWEEAFVIQSRVLNDMTSLLGPEPDYSAVIYYKNMGQIYLELGDLDESERYLQQALNIYGNIVERDPYVLLRLHRVLAWLNYQQGNLNEAARILTTTVKLKA